MSSSSETYSIVKEQNGEWKFEVVQADLSLGALQDLIGSFAVMDRKSLLIRSLTWRSYAETTLILLPKRCL